MQTTKSNPAIGQDALLPAVHISLRTIQDNYTALKSYIGAAEASAVVKANCYGHDMAHVAPALYDAGCRTFFTAYLSEAIELRALIGDEASIFVFNGIQPDETETFSAQNISPVCNDEQQVQLCISNAFSGQYALHFDTGMNRLGVRPALTKALSVMTEHKPPALVMSHLACADTPGHPANTAQLASFSNIAASFPNSRKSLSNTAGIYLGPDYHFDLVRPGIGLYGGGPARPPEIKLKTALTLTAPILSVFYVEPGETVGYGATYDVRQPSRLATVALGYADGFLRAASNFGFGVLAGMPCPIVGRVSMDLITIDVTDLPDIPTKGDRVEFIGPKAGYEIQAEAMGTLGYELTSRLGQRISRSWGE